MTLDLDELERLEREATSGPWRSIASDLLLIRSYEYQVPHAALIAAARNALPALLAHVRGLEAELPGKMRVSVTHQESLLAELRALRARVRCSACLPWENPCETCARTAERINATPPEPAAPLSRCWRCKHDVPEDTVVCFAGVGTQCKDREACRERSYVAPEPATPPEHPQTQIAYRLGCVVGAAIVAWGDAMRGMVRRAPVQGDRANPPGSIDWEEHLAVYDCYAVKYGRDQSAERLAQRGGFGKQEAEMLLGRPLRTWRRVDMTPHSP